jgi:predicted transposase/invertase (TIGR01784 family)
MSTLLKSELDYQSGMVDARRKGLAEGIQEGHAEKALEIARKMKNAGRPLSEIAEFTGLDIGTLEQLG